MRKVVNLLIVLGFLLVSSSALAEANVLLGKEKSAACAACHGVDGNSSSPMFPKIAGQHADYIIHALQAYKSAKRKNPMMQMTVNALSDQDMADLAAYFAAQKGLETLRR